MPFAKPSGNGRARGREAVTLDQLARAALDDLAAKDRLRRLRAYRRMDTPLHLQREDGRLLVDFSSNDYLGLGRHPLLIERARDWAARFGAGAGAARLVTGTLDAYRAVETKLAAFKGTQAALIFNSGFQLNATVLPALAELCGGLQVFADRLNHASLHHGVAAAGLCQQRFRHNDLAHLESLLRQDSGQKGARLIVTESVFSMDGDLCDLAALAALGKRYGAFLYVDEAHATGVLGPNGRGLAAALPDGVDLAMGTFGKALGSFGAYAAGSQALIDYLASRASGFIYSTALPPAVMGAIDAAIDLLPDLAPARARLTGYADQVRAGLRARGLDCGASASQIVPVLLGGESRALAAQAALEEAGLLAVAIRPPTVPEGQSRLRLSLSAAHEAADIARLLESLALIEAAS